MKFNAPDHFSHSFELKLAHLPTKKSDRISLSICIRDYFLARFWLFSACMNCLTASIPLKSFWRYCQP